MNNNVIWPVKWTPPEGATEMTEATDVSPHGCFIKSRTRIKADTRVRVCLRVAKGVPLYVNGEVSCFTETGFVVQFRDLTDEALSLLSQVAQVAAQA
jgi:PilZ domain